MWTRKRSAVVFPADVHPTNTTAADEAIVPASGEDSERNSVASFRGAAADKRASASSGDRTSGGRTSSVESLAGVRQRLDDAHAAGRRFRRRVQLPIMLLGMTMHCGGFALVVVAAALGEWSALHFAPSVIIVGSFFTMSALLSSNHRLIDVAYTFCALTCSALSVGHASLLAIDMQGYEARSPSPSGGGACAAFILGPVECAFLPIEMAWSAASIVPVLVLLVHMLRWRLHALPWRSLLDRLWVGLGRACMTWGACTLIYLCVAFGMGIGTLTAGTLAQRRYWWSMVVGVLTGIGVGGLCLHPQTRVRMQAFLASRSETVAAATGVAALLGDAAPEIVLARGVALFRSIRIADLTEADLESNSSSAELYARSTPAHFHQVDAFVSHSWSDPAESKFLELVKWRTAFVRRHGREPTVWLDKACLSQSNLSESLGSLPVFLAGCNSLLVLAGESYTSRLWCVVELFVFLVMQPAGAVRNIALYPLGSDGGQELLEQLAHFDAESATCLLADDQDRLLRTIEAGFGGFGKFNAEVGGILSQLVRDRVEADAADARSTRDGHSNSISRERVRRISSNARTLAGRTTGRLSPGLLSTTNSSGR